MHNIYICTLLQIPIFICTREKNIYCYTLAFPAPKKMGNQSEWDVLSSFDKVPTPTLNIALFLSLIYFGAKELVMKSYKPTFFIKC